MCGITGFISSRLNQHHLSQMTTALKHRGPDASGEFYLENDHLALGHRRLSILDLSANGNQPFRSRCGRYTMVYNGEVYNFNEIAKQLQIETATFTDTEVILEAYAIKKDQFVDLLNGMFSMAIWDNQEKSLQLFRDRIGIKPLYYYWDGKNFAFASELKVFKNLPFEFTINQRAIANYLHLGYVPGDHTIYQQIKKLEPGHQLKVIDNKIHIEAFWKIEDQIKPKRIVSITEAKKTLHNLVIESVKKRMISDVPLGTFLSGGIDSSLVTSVAQSLSDKPVKTFSIGFKENKFDESLYAQKVAKELKTEHFSYILSQKEAIEKVEEILNIYDEPFADSSAIPTLIVSEIARKHVTVALSGDGGDEQFMGYGMYQWANRLSNPLIKLNRQLIHLILRSSPRLRHQRAASYFNYLNENKIKSHIFSQDQNMFSEKEIERLLKENYHLDLINDNSSVDSKLSNAEQQAFFDLKNYLPEDLLVKVDRASMHNSLEIRVPLLDHSLVEYSVNLHENLKIRQGITKFILKEILFEYVPRHLFERPKWGFSIPLSTWLQTDLKYLIDQYLNAEMVKDLNVVSVKEVERIKQEFFGGKEFYYNRIWLLIVLHKWLSHN